MTELPDVVAAAHGTYLSVFESFLGGHDIVDIAVHEGRSPGSLSDCDGWVLSGSPASTYDDLGWIPMAEEIVRDLITEERPTFGICFGHQLMAQALGGRVERAGVGWGAGVHRYDLIAPIRQIPDPPSQLQLLAMHQDQVVDVPSGGVVWATSTFCPNAGISYGERAWSMQPHPEFTPGIVETLCHDRRDRLGGDVADAAIAGLRRRLDGELVARAVDHGVEQAAGSHRTH